MNKTLIASQVYMVNVSALDVIDMLRATGNIPSKSKARTHIKDVKFSATGVSVEYSLAPVKLPEHGDPLRLLSVKGVGNHAQAKHMSTDEPSFIMVSPAAVEQLRAAGIDVSVPEYTEND